MKSIKGLLRDGLIHDSILNVRRKWVTKSWEHAGRPIPPPEAYKQEVVRQYARAYGIEVLIETGTHAGGMIYAARKHFRQIYSVELDLQLYQYVKERLGRQRHISIIHGDSGRVLGKILAKISEPCLFWLDAHYSGGITTRGESETPIREELDHIFHHGVPNHVILIDDARYFNGENGYPTIKELETRINQAGKHHRLWIEHDIMRITPSRAVALGVGNSVYGG